MGSTADEVAAVGPGRIGFMGLVVSLCLAVAACSSGTGDHELASEAPAGAQSASSEGTPTTTSVPQGGR